MKIPIFTRAERNAIAKLREGRSWDPDFRALLTILDTAQNRFDERVKGLDLLVEANALLKRMNIGAIFFDIFGSGKVGVTRRSGIFGVGPDLRAAVRHLQTLDNRPLDRRLDVATEMAFTDTDPDTFAPEEPPEKE